MSKKSNHFVSRSEITKVLLSLKEKIPGAEDLLIEMKNGLPFIEAEERASVMLAAWRVGKG